MQQISTGISSSRSGADQLLLLLICRVRLYCDAIVTRLNKIEAIRVISCDDVSEGAVDVVQSAAPDVVLLDMGRAGALALAVAILKVQPGARILGFGVDDVAPQVVACAEAGLCGYVSADASLNDLARAAWRVARGETICSAAIAESLFRHLGDAARGVTPVHAALTRRQRQILQLIKEGLSNKEIAQRLSLGPSTVKNHVHGLLGRLQVGRRGEAAALFDRGRSLRDDLNKVSERA